MLEYSRQKWMEQMIWNSGENNVPNVPQIFTLECWSYEGMSHVEEHRNYRSMSLNLELSSNLAAAGSVSEELHRWLHLKEPYLIPEAPTQSPIVQGGIRVAFCDRHDLDVGIGLRRLDFEAIEKAFKLHASTLTAFSVRAGTHGIFYETNPDTEAIESISIVIKAPQRRDVCNYTVSIHYDVSSGWTNALICGAGTIVPRKMQEGLESQFGEITTLIQTNPTLWNNPLFLAFVILHDHNRRVDIRATQMVSELSGFESQIGVTSAGITVDQFDRVKWPQSFDPKTVTISLHSISTRLQNLRLSFEWHHNYASALLTALHEITGFSPCSKHRHGLQRMKQHVEFLRVTNHSRQARVAAFEHRANLQINVLHSMISQQDSLVNRQDALLNFRIAKSSKQDSVSMTTFTFITALFLPGTFIATLFSMTMFDWRINVNPNDNTSSTDSLQVSTRTLSYVSDKFWIFWVVTVPLTIITMTTWYFWSKFSNDKWLEELRMASAQDQHVPGLSKISSQEPKSQPDFSLRVF